MRAALAANEVNKLQKKLKAAPATTSESPRVVPADSPASPATTSSSSGGGASAEGSSEVKLVEEEETIKLQKKIEEMSGHMFAAM